MNQMLAGIYPPDSEGLSQLLPETDCGKCGFAGCFEFAEALILNQAKPSKCPDLDRRFSEVLTVILSMNRDPVPLNVMMEQAPCTLMEINGPDKNSPLLVTCNFRDTVHTLREILQRTETRAFLLPTFTNGFTVDNAVDQRMFKAVEIWKAIQENAVQEKIGTKLMIIPGLAEMEKNAIRRITAWEVLVGPVSGFLLPLYILKNHKAFT